jgi:hypothetical protein
MPQRTEKENKTIQLVLDAFESSRRASYRQYKAEVWDKCYKAWRGYVEKYIPRKSNLFIPITQQTVETIVSREMTAIFNENGRIFQFEPRQASYQGNADILTEYVNYDFLRVPHVYRKFRKFLTQLHIYGTSILRVFWDYKEFRQPAVDENGKPFQKLIFDRDQFNFDVVPVRNFYIDPRADNLQDAKWVITRSIVDREIFKEQMKALEYRKLSMQEIDRISTARVRPEYDDTFSDLDNLEAIALDSDRQFIEVIEYWSRQTDRFITIAGGEYVVRDEPIPFDHKQYPFIVCVDIPDPEHFWGLSTVEVIHDLQHELNSLRNNRMDKANFLLNPMFKVQQGEVLNRSELISRPGGIVRVRAMDGLSPMEMGDMSSSDYNEEQIIKGDIQTTTGISDFALGQTSPRYSETATGVSILSSNADSRIMTKIHYIQEEGLGPLGRQWLSLQKQFGKNSEIFRVTGKDVLFEKEMLTHPMDVRVLASTQMINKQVRQNQVMQLAQLVLNNPSVNQEEWLRLVFETFNFPVNKLLIGPQPTPPAPEAEALQRFQGAQQPETPGNTQPTEQGNLEGYDFVQGRPVNA